MMAVMSRTPILDLQRDPPAAKSQRGSQLVGWAVGGAIGLIGPFGTILAIQYGFRLPGFNILMFLAALYAGIVLHECAHLLVGKLVGFGFGGIAVGGFVLLRSGDRWTVKFDARWLLGGFAKPLPKMGNYRRADFAWMVGAGPIVNFLLVMAAAGAWLRYGNGGWNWIGSALWAYALLGLMTLLPTQNAANRSDIWRLWQCAFDPLGSRSWMAVLALQTGEAAGMRPRDWDRGLLREVLADRGTDGEYFYRNLLAYYALADAGDATAAMDHLEKALAKSGAAPPKARCLVFMEAAFANAAFQNSAANGRRWIDRARGIGEKEIGIADALVAMREFRYQDALRYLGEATTRFGKKRLDSGLARYAKARYAEHEAECRAALKPPALPFEAELLSRR
jgi:hypothetical protein